MASKYILEGQLLRHLGLNGNRRRTLTMAQALYRLKRTDETLRAKSNKAHAEYLYFQSFLNNYQSLHRRVKATTKQKQRNNRLVPQELLL